MKAGTNRPLDLDLNEQIRAEVVRIRSEFPYRGDYREQLRELVQTLFFRFDERAGAQRLVNLLAENGKSPSTGTAQDEINKFWVRIREASQVRFQRADLPQFLLEIFGKAAADLWENSLEAANATYEDFRADAESRVRDATAVSADHEARASEALARASDAEARASSADRRREEMAVELAAAKAALAAAETTLREMRDEAATLERQRSETIASLQKTVGDMRDASVRLQDEQRRLLVVADDYKTAAARDRDALASERENSRALSQTMQTMQGAINRLNQERGIFEGRAVAAENLADRLQADRDRALSDTSAALEKASQSEKRVAELITNLRKSRGKAEGDKN